MESQDICLAKGCNNKATVGFDEIEKRFVYCKKCSEIADKNIEDAQKRGIKMVVK